MLAQFLSFLFISIVGAATTTSIATNIFCSSDIVIIENFSSEEYNGKIGLLLEDVKEGDQCVKVKLFVPAKTITVEIENLFKPCYPESVLKSEEEIESSIKMANFALQNSSPNNCNLTLYLSKYKSITSLTPIDRESISVLIGAVISVAKLSDDPVGFLYDERLRIRLIGAYIYYCNGLDGLNYAIGIEPSFKRQFGFSWAGIGDFVFRM